MAEAVSSGCYSSTNASVIKLIQVLLRKIHPKVWLSSCERNDVRLAFSSVMIRVRVWMLIQVC